jgi:hypothetical protein
MKNPTEQLNEMIRTFSKENANTHISQFSAIIDLCLKAGIRFSIDENYKNELASFQSDKYPEWNAEITNAEIESLARDGKYDEATAKRDKSLALMNEIHRQFRLSKYRTEDWFIESSESALFFIPTEIAVIDGLINEKVFNR